MPIKIFVVDDSRVMRTYIRGALTAIDDCEVLEAGSGFEALRLLPREHFDLIIADINMPDINGLELVKFVRSSERHAQVPIIVVSTQAGDRGRTRAGELGADGFLAKPFTPEALVAEVRALIADRRDAEEETDR